MMEEIKEAIEGILKDSPNIDGVLVFAFRGNEMQRSLIINEKSQIYFSRIIFEMELYKAEICLRHIQNKNLTT
jgi:hypothetical protein